MWVQPMKKTVLSMALAGLTATTPIFADVPDIAVDIAPVHSLVAHVMGTLGEPELVVSPGASPHGYSLRPSEAQALQDAEIVFWIGPGLTPWLADALETLAPDAKHMEMLEIAGTTELEFREGALFEAHAHDEHGDDEHGDDEHSDDEHSDDEHSDDEHHDDHHDEHDPHAWLDPSNAAIWLDSIADVLSAADPDNAGTYSANAASGKVMLDALKSDVEKILTPVRDRNFIVFHDAYQYFETAFNFPASGAISIGDASDPSPARIQQIHDRVSDASVTCVLAESQFNPDLVETVLDGTDANSGTIDPLGSHIEIGPILYPTLLRDLAQTLADCV